MSDSEKSRVSFEIFDHFEVTRGRQTFRLLRCEPYTRRDGQQSQVLVWSVRCATCGEDYEETTPRKFTITKNRRCDECKEGKVTLTKVRSAMRKLRAAGIRINDMPDIGADDDEADDSVDDADVGGMRLGEDR